MSSKSGKLAKRNYHAEKSIGYDAIVRKAGSRQKPAKTNLWGDRSKTTPEERRALPGEGLRPEGDMK